jgi:hypothetical protein
MNLGNGPPNLSPLDTMVIQWNIPKDGICLLELFGGISCGLIVVLQLGILVWRYNYVGRIHKPNKPRCSMLWCCNKGIPTCYQHRPYRVINVPYQATSPCWGCHIWQGLGHLIWSILDGHVKFFTSGYKLRIFWSQVRFILGMHLCCATFTIYTYAPMCIFVGKCSTIRGF